MEKITIGQIAVALAFIVALWGSIETISKKISKAFDASLDKKLKPLEDKIDKLDQKVNTVDMNATKNFLLARIEETKHGGIDDITRMRMLEQYEHYKALGGNSFIAGEMEKLKKESKI
jgi:hypothetical protein